MHNFRIQSRQPSIEKSENTRYVESRQKLDLNMLFFQLQFNDMITKLTEDIKFHWPDNGTYEHYWCQYFFSAQ